MRGGGCWWIVSIEAKGMVDVDLCEAAAGREDREVAGACRACGVDWLLGRWGAGSAHEGSSWWQYRGRRKAEVPRRRLGAWIANNMKCNARGREEAWCTALWRIPQSEFS